MDAERRIADLEAQLAIKEQLNAELRARVAELEAKLAEFTSKVSQLTEEQGRDSSNSSQPPSSDSPSVRAKRNQRRAKSKGTRRRRGGQPNHRGAHRQLLDADKVDEVVDLFPSECEDCATRLPETKDPHALRFQVTELPAFEPHTTEYRRHSVACPCCEHTTRGPTERLPASPFGPRLMSVVALLTGAYHVSRRKTRDLLADLVGVRISLGAVSAVEARVSDAVEKPVHEAWQRVATARVKHTDGTSWFQAGVMLSLWVIASVVATVFKIVANGRKETLAPLFGKQRGILVSDRATALNFWAMERRQICWAHLLRKFVSFAQRDGPSGKFGQELLEYVGLIFSYWHDVRDGRMERTQFRTWMAPVRLRVEELLERASKSGIAPLAGSCTDILAHREALWTFVDQHGVEPTNNHAERELREFVLWRKRSYGTQSERGNRFAERLMTVTHTARKQKKNVLEFLTECCVAHIDGGKQPSLFAPESAT